MELGGKGRRERERMERREGMGDGLRRRLRPWTQREGEQRGIRSAEAAIISRHHYLYGLEIYANAISGMKCWTKWVTGVKRNLCSCLAMAQA